MTKPEWASSVTWNRLWAADLPHGVRSEGVQACGPWSYRRMRFSYLVFARASSRFAVARRLQAEGAGSVAVAF